VPASVASYGYVPSSIPVTLMMKALSSSETSVLARATRRKIPEGSILLKRSFNIAKEAIVWDTKILMESYVSYENGFCILWIYKLN
jgi:hypothetical protein